jgi:DNA-binding NtrC family response regulator
MLIVDDDPVILSALRDILAQPDVEIITAAHGAEAMLQLDERPFDLLLTDLQLPDLSGMDLIKRIQQEGIPTLCILMTGHATVDNAVEALKSGAYDYVTKPFKATEVRHMVEQALSRQRLAMENRQLQSELARHGAFEGIVGRSKAMQEIFRIIERVRDLDATVLITGPSGAGKEVIARAIHRSGRRKGRPFVGINCGAIPENLIEDELFGHVKGAFTDASAPRQGVFEQAAQGTLFLDEITTLRSDLQVKLLRVLQEREYCALGSSNSRKTDVRIIVATNDDLRDLVARGQFREDLFYRINIIHIAVPPLRERPEDILPLVDHFTKRICQRMGVEAKVYSQEALEAMLQYSWPGNVRELENAIERTLALSENPSRIEITDLPIELRNVTRPAVPEAGVRLPAYVEAWGLDAYLERMERAVITEVLNRHRWMKSKAAKALKLNRTTLVERMKRRGIPLKREGGSKHDRRPRKAPPSRTRKSP